MPPAPGAFLLTGGAGRRMGTDKAGLAVGGTTLARRGADLLLLVAAPVLEVGPGATDLEALPDEAPGRGPLVAVAGAWSRLTAGLGPDRPAGMLVVACDLPRLTPDLLRLIVGEMAGAPGVAVVPEVQGRLQSLCAGYPAEALDRAVDLVAAGARSFRDLLAAVAWRPWPASDRADTLIDVDTPEDLERLGLPGLLGRRREPA